MSAGGGGWGVSIETFPDPCSAALGHLFPKFVFNHRISTMMVVTGNFRNAVDRDGLHGGLFDPKLLCAGDKTR